MRARHSKQARRFEALEPRLLMAFWFELDFVEGEVWDEGWDLGWDVGWDDSGYEEEYYYEEDVYGEAYYEDAGYVYPDEYENDDQWEWANEISTDNWAQYHSIDVYFDQDWVYFYVPTRSDVVIETDGYAGDTEMWLYKSTDMVQPIFYDDDLGDDEFSKLTRTGSQALPAGVYYLQVASRDEVVIGEYSLQVSVTPNAQVNADPLFDEGWYVGQYPEVEETIAAGFVSTPWDHFVEYGQYANWDPSAWFSSNYYLEKNPDVAAAIPGGGFTSAYNHYVRHGRAEGRSTSVFFDERFYRQNNPDVAAAIARGAMPSGVVHFIEFGMFENRDPLREFDTEYYLWGNADVAASDYVPYLHFLNYGQFEWRSPRADFDELAYLVKNPDVAGAVDAGYFYTGWSHWVEYGFKEGRVSM